MNHGYWMALCLVLCAATACKPEASTSDPASSDSRLRKIQLQLNWFPEAEHGGFYTAQLAGFYAEEGLDVEILAGGPGASVIQKAAAGTVTFAVANADQVVIGRHQQADVVALMAPLQDSPRSIMLHADSDVEGFDDLEGLTIAMGSGKAYARFMEKQGLLEGVQIVSYSGSVARFLTDKDFAQQAYIFSEPFLAQQQGAATRNLMVSTLGFNPYTSILITSGDQLQADRELVDAMVRASIRGWHKYLQDPVETNQRINELNENMGLEILAFGVEQLKPLCLPAGMTTEQLGQMTLDRWQTLTEQLKEIGMLEQAVDASECFYLGGLPKQ